MLRRTLLYLILSLLVQIGWAQPPGTVSQQLKAKAAEEEGVLEEDYENRLTKSTLYGVYIPKDLPDVFNELNQKTDEGSRKKFAGMTEEDAGHKLHFSLGRWIIHNWGFYGGSRLTSYFNGFGLYEPDDMARFIIITYHRELNNKPLGVKELVEGFQAMRKAERERRLEQGEVIHEETRKRPIKENE